MPSSTGSGGRSTGAITRSSSSTTPARTKVGQARRARGAPAEVRGLDLSRNVGQHNALLAGIRAARGAVIVTLDDDLQNPPEEIPRLLARLEEGYDVVYGTPNVRQHKRWRNVAARLVRYSLRSSMGQVADLVSPFRALRTQLRDTFRSFAGPDVSIDVLLSWSTSRFSSVEVEHAERSSGPSTYSFGKLASLALTMLTGFSTGRCGSRACSASPARCSACSSSSGSSCGSWSTGTRSPGSPSWRR